METPSWLDRRQWPYPPRWIALAEGRLHYVDERVMPARDLEHGTPTWSFEWRHVIATMRDDTRVLAPDHLGFGLSAFGPPPQATAPKTTRGDSASGLRTSSRASPLHLVVHDYGGPHALDWALDHRDPGS